MAGLSFEQIVGKIREGVGDVVVDVTEGGLLPFVKIEANAVARVARLMRDDADLSFDFLMYIGAVDYPAEEKITLVYHYFSYRDEQSFMVKADVPRQGATVHSITHLYAAADWLEREIFDLFGVSFEGHPNMTRILTPEGFEGHPLLKDFANEDYVPFPDKMPGK
jgi:NADH-quinone oxidoreductase subunit C